MHFNKRFIALFLLSLAVLTSNLLLGFGSSKDVFRWIDNINHLHQEIDLETMEYSIETKAGVWVSKGKVKTNGIDLNLFPKDYYVQYNVVRDKILFNIPGTGLVYSFDKASNQLERIDNTFFKGFNFHSYSFTKNDTLFSLGGEGFWSTNSTLVYFDPKLREWEKKMTANKGPGSIDWKFGGYSSSNNSFYGLEGKEEFKMNDFKDKSLFALDLKTFIWKELGKINTSKFSNQTQVNQFIYWLDSFFLYLDGFNTNVYILDPINNKIFQYKGNKTQIKQGSNEVFRDGNYIYIYHKDSNGANLDSITVKDLLNNSTEIDLLYKASFPLPWDNINYLLMAVLVISVFALFLKNRKYISIINHYHRPTEIKNLPESLNRVLRHFQKHGSNTLLSTNEMNDLLNIKANSFESTRQQRSRDLKTINDYFFIHFGIEEAIKRRNSEQDKRITLYSLEEKAFKVLSKINLGK